MMIRLVPSSTGNHRYYKSPFWIYICMSRYLFLYSYWMIESNNITSLVLTKFLPASSLTLCLTSLFLLFLCQVHLFYIVILLPCCLSPWNPCVEKSCLLSNFISVNYNNEGLLIYYLCLVFYVSVAD